MTKDEAKGLVLAHFPYSRMTRSRRAGGGITARLYSSPGVWWCDAYAVDYEEAKRLAWEKGAHLLRERYPLDPAETSMPFSLEALEDRPIARILVQAGWDVLGLRDARPFGAVSCDLEGWVNGRHQLWNSRGASLSGNPAMDLILAVR